MHRTRLRPWMDAADLYSYLLIRVHPRPSVVPSFSSAVSRKEAELAVFEILTRPGPDLTPMEAEAIKKVCKDLLAKLKTEKLVLAWRTKRTTRAAVRVEIEKMLDSGLPEKYTTELFEQKCGVLFQHVLEKYPESGESVYLAAAG